MGYTYTGPPDQTICMNCVQLLGKAADTRYRKMYGLPASAHVHLQANLKARTMEAYSGSLPREVFTFEDLGVETC